MEKPKFKNDDIVVFDPVGDFRGEKGRIIGTVYFNTGNIAYFVSAGRYDGGVARHLVDECELRAVDAVVDA